ncbi:glycosyltransferase family 2 protein [bacterium]|nr:MAG: glycosyltransferase family 2 protein [bacterium]
METKQPKVYLVIPAFNEGEIIVDVIDDIKKHGFSNIIVVDDGSKDDTYEKANNVIGVTALKHKLNRGYGATVKTGVEAAKMLDADIVVTFDGDGQHDPGDIAEMISPIVNSDCDVVLGTRLLDTAGMPFYKIIANQVGNFFTWLLFGIWVTDSQSGFRAFSRNAIEKIKTKSERYEYSSEIIREIKHKKLKFKEAPIKVRYTQYSMGKAQKQTFTNGLKTLFKMVWNLIS